jgi:ribonuclease BN (tRNA processing enzyme)
VVGRETTLLLDCGPTTLLALKREGIPVDDVDAVLLSHFHGDHFAGIPFLLLELMYETPRQRPLVIAGPPGTRIRVEDLHRVMYRDLASRPMPFELQFVDLEPGTPARVGGADVLPFRVPHQETEMSLGLRVELVVQSRGADLFICECCYFDSRYEFHLDYPRIAENLSRFGCRRLVLTHLGREVHAHRDEVDIELACEGLVVEL